jgi:DNA repair protein RadC
MEETIHQGHRQRMRRRMKKFGPGVFDTYELLEMLLYNTVPVKDTNPIAKSLLMRFGSLDGVLSASIEELKTVDGVGDKSAGLIHTVGKALELSKYNGENESDHPKTYEEFGEYLVDYFKGKKDSVTVLVSLNNSMRIIGIDEVYAMDCAYAGVRPKAFIDTALDRSASVIMIAHNHTYGSFIPSEADRETTILIEDAFSDLGIELAEHYVVSGSKYLGFLNHMGCAFSQKPALEAFYKSKRRSHAE